MTFDERLYLYALIRGRQPRRVLEVGTARGGSALVITTALDRNGGNGHVWSVDPLPRLALSLRLYRGRFTQIAEPSPSGIHTAAAQAREPFDLIFIDGLHTYTQVGLDLAAAIEHARDGALILLHDAFHLGVSTAIAEAISAEPRLRDCGYACSRVRPIGDLLTHAGLRVLRLGSQIEEPDAHVDAAYAAAGLPPPLRDPRLLDHDLWYCGYVQPCDYCRARAEQAGPSPR